MSRYNNVNSSKSLGKRKLIHTCVCKQDAEIPQDFRQFGNIYIYRDVCKRVCTAGQQNYYCAVSLLCVLSASITKIDELKKQRQINQQHWQKHCL